MNKALIVTNNAGGLYLFRKDLIVSLFSAGYAVSAVTPFTSRISELKELGVDLINIQIDRRGKNLANDVILLNKYRKVIEQIHPDLIITYTIKPNIYVGIIAASKGIPYAANITGLGTALQNNGILKEAVMKLYRLALKKAKVVFFENKSNAVFFLDNKIIKKGQEKVLNGAGVDTGHFAYLEYPEDNDCFNFLFVGRIMKEKGIDELFAATKRLINEGVNCKLTLVGTLEENYKDIIEKYEKDGWIDYVGFKEDVRVYIKQCHCSVLPSWHEGMSNTNLESASCGRPVITTDIPGCREAVINGKSGFLCKKQDCESLYFFMRKFIELPFNIRKEMGICGRKLMQSEFEKTSVVTETIRALGIT